MFEKVENMVIARSTNDWRRPLAALQENLTFCLYSSVCT